VTFRHNQFNNVEGLLQFVQEQKGTAKLRPDQKLVLMRPWDSLSYRMKGVKAFVKALDKL
jgi:transcription-repair coupling factor (superfamily II helicase)